MSPLKRYRGERAPSLLKIRFSVVTSLLCSLVIVEIRDLVFCRENMRFEFKTKKKTEGDFFSPGTHVGKVLIISCLIKCNLIDEFLSIC